MKRRTLIALFGLTLLPWGVGAQECNQAMRVSTPTEAFEIHADGTATHRATGLTWQRCLAGQTFADNGTPADPRDDRCDGAARTYDWQAALAYADSLGNGWRLPNIKELPSIVERSCWVPAINLTVFPDHPSSWVWSGSPNDYTNDAWNVGFSYGGDGGGSRGLNLRVRVVRGGQ